MIEDYIVVNTFQCNEHLESDEIDSLMEKVKDRIAQGYEPTGGVAVRMGQQSGAYFLQAMVKRRVL